MLDVIKDRLLKIFEALLLEFEGVVNPSMPASLLTKRPCEDTSGVRREKLIRLVDVLGPMELVGVTDLDLSIAFKPEISVSKFFTSASSLVFSASRVVASFMVMAAIFFNSSQSVSKV